MKYCRTGRYITAIISVILFFAVPELFSSEVVLDVPEVIQQTGNSISFTDLFQDSQLISFQASKYGKADKFKDGVVMAVSAQLTVTLAAGFSVLTLIPALVLTSFYHTIYTTAGVYAGMITSWSLFGFFTLASIVFTVIWMIYLSNTDNVWTIPLLITEIVIASFSALAVSIGTSAIYSTVQVVEVLAGMIASWVTFSLMCISVPIILLSMVFIHLADKKMYLPDDELAIAFRL